MAREHILRQLSLPDRYERLVARLGAEVVQLLVPPEQATLDQFERAALAVQTRDEGLLIPVHGESGIGKTTLLDNLTHFLPSNFTQTLNYQGLLSFDALQEAAQNFSMGYPADERRILPINVDQRENYAPTDQELAEIKRFLRTSPLAIRPSIFWPDTNADNARHLARRFTAVAGESPIRLPVEVGGPPRAAWVDIVKNTLRLANEVESLETLGVDPGNYDPARFRALGAFLRRVSTEFDNLRFELQKQTRRPLFLLVVFPSESQEPGILSQLTSSSRYGLLDAQALVGVTAASEIGRWWSARRGLLTRAIVQLDAHALFLPPSVSVGMIRRYGSEEMQQVLAPHGIRKPGVARLVRDLARSDFGKFLSGTDIRAYEARGTPAETSVNAFRKLAEQGFILGRDRALNKATGAALADCMAQLDVEPDRVQTETKLDFCALIPDNAVYTSDGVLCLEYHWRRGDFLLPRNRSAVAQYVLKKLRDYVRQLRWTAD